MDVRNQELQTIINEGRGKATTILSEIQTEFQNREDCVVKPNKMEFSIAPSINRLDLSINGQSSSLTNFARNQILGRCSIPVTYAKKLLEVGEHNLLLENINKMNVRNNSGGLLVRRVEENIKGVLSPSYRRIDAAPIFESFVASCLGAGYVPYTGRVTDYRYHLCFIHPEVFQPSENEFIVFGIAITTSDYGAASLKVEQVILRISCKNLALGNDSFKSVHIGKRFEAGSDFVKLSNQTNILDAKATASAVSDVVTSAQGHIGVLKDKINHALLKEVNIDQAVASIRSKGFSKSFAEGVRTMYQADLPVQHLPKGENVWRLSNAISLLAGSQESSDTALDAQGLAMAVL